MRREEKVGEKGIKQIKGKRYGGSINAERKEKEREKLKKRKEEGYEVGGIEGERQVEGKRGGGSSEGEHKEEKNRCIRLGQEGSRTKR